MVNLTHNMSLVNLFIAANVGIDEKTKQVVKRFLIQSAKCLKSYSDAVQPTPSSVIQIQRLKTEARRNG